MSASKNRIYFLLQRAAHRLKTEADGSLLEACGLTTAQAAVMTIVAEDGPVTQKHIASALAQRESAITAMASRLVKAGFITKNRSTTDSRAFDLTITEAGETALSATRTAFGEINAKLDADISAVEMDVLAQQLQKILRAFEK
jgi:DNA-binding MarR family transcriptional regulator